MKPPLGVRKNPLPLSLENLALIANSATVPAYNRAALSPGILHIGVGNFHRAHQAVYLDELFGLGLNQDWAIVGAGVRAADADMRAKLMAQDWLTTIVERDAFGQSARVTGAMIDYVAPGDTAKVLEWLADPRIRIVSLTITEGGYFHNSATGKFDSENPEIVVDATNPDEPQTAFGLIVAGLRARRSAGMAPFTIMSCDNIPGNGHVTREVVAGLALLSDPALAEWIGQSVAFPNSMVDRITPATSDLERALVAQSYGILDASPVACETFRQWVVEDNFPAGRPRLEEVGVTFVSDVEPFELMKLRILNGGHAAIAYPAGLLDIEYVHEAMAEPLIVAFLEKLERSEVLPAVPPVPGTSLETYLTKVIERFANPTVGDTIRRLCLDGSNRQPKFILPTVRDRLAADQDVAGLALVSALWCRYCAGTTESGAEIAPNDPAWPQLQALALLAKDDPSGFLSMHHIFGDLATTPAYVHSFTRALQSIWSTGVRETLENYVSGRP